MKIASARVIVTCPGRNFVTLLIETDEGLTGVSEVRFGSGGLGKNEAVNRLPGSGMACGQSSAAKFAGMLPHSSWSPLYDPPVGTMNWNVNFEAACPVTLFIHRQ